MEAVAALLRGLPLQPEESDRGDLMEAKSQLFLKYEFLFIHCIVKSPILISCSLQTFLQHCVVALYHKLKITVKHTNLL